MVVALADGGSSLATRSLAAIVVWWTILLAMAFSLAPRAPVSRPAVACVGLLVAFAVLSAVSIAWAPSAERAFAEADRVLLYAGIALVAVLLARPGSAGSVLDGLALGVGAIGVVALGGRLLPSVFGTDDLATLLPDAATRLTHPIGYWNGLAMFLALGVPLLLRAATIPGRAAAWRALAIAPVPILAAAAFLTSSRGGFAVAALGTLVFVVLTADRFRAVQALAVAAAGSVVAVAVLQSRGVLVEGPLGTAAAESAGEGAAALIAGVCVATGAAFALMSRLLPARLPVPRVAWGVCGALLLAGVVVSDPAARLRQFKAAPEGEDAGSVDIGAHLASGGGSGRWQFWDAALDEFSRYPLAGGGAGSYESWWLQHGSLDWFVRNAHSLWLETLGELGLAGLLLLGAAFAVGVATGVRRLRAAPPEDRATPAALLAVLLAFTLGAAIDWVWQLPALVAMVMVCLGLLVGPATDHRPHAPGPGTLSAGRRWLLVVAAWAVVCAQAIPFLAGEQITASQRAVARGDLPAALESAASARTLQPWAASPYSQTALVHEQAGRMGPARAAAAEAIERDDRDWRLQVIAARLAVQDGDIAAARRALAAARRLNPRSRLLEAARRPGG